MAVANCAHIVENATEGVIWRGSTGGGGGYGGGGGGYGGGGRDGGGMGAGGPGGPQLRCAPAANSSSLFVGCTSAACILPVWCNTSCALC
jgi:hypothetical protein